MKNQSFIYHKIFIQNYLKSWQKYVKSWQNVQIFKWLVTFWRELSRTDLKEKSKSTIYIKFAKSASLRPSVLCLVGSAPSPWISRSRLSAQTATGVWSLILWIIRASWNNRRRVGGILHASLNYRSRLQQYRTWTWRHKRNWHHKSKILII